MRYFSFAILTRILHKKGDGLSKDFENQRVAEAQAITGYRRAFCNPLSSKDCSSRDRLHAICGLTLLFAVGSVFSAETVRITGLSSPQLKIQRTPARMIMGNIRTQVSEKFENAIYILIPRGASGKPGQGYSFTVDRPVTVYLAAHKRGKPTIPSGWLRVPDMVSWGHSGQGSMTTDTVYRRDFPAGKVEIPPHDGFDGKMYGIPHLAIIPLGTPPKPLAEWALPELHPAPSPAGTAVNGRPFFHAKPDSTFAFTVPANRLTPGKVYTLTVSGSSKAGGYLTLSADRKLLFPFGAKCMIYPEFSRAVIPFTVSGTEALRLTLRLSGAPAQLEAPRLFADQSGILPREGQVKSCFPSPAWKPVDMSRVLRIPDAGSALDFSKIAISRPIGEKGRIIINREGKCATELEPETPLRFRGAGMNVIPDRKKIDRDIRQMKRLGINLVRFHGPDFVKGKYKRGGVTIDNAAMIPQSDKEFREYFDEEKLKAFDYALAKLAQNGIYVFCDLMAGFCGWTDATQPGHWVGKDLLGKEFHAQLYVNNVFRRNWAEGVKYLLNRINTVNGRRYADDPVFAFFLFMNEQDFRINPGYLSAFEPEWKKFYGPNAPELSEKLLKSDSPQGRKASEFMLGKIEEMTRFFHGVVRSTGCKTLLTNWDLYMRMIDSPGRELLEVSTLHSYHGHAGLPLPPASVPGYPVQTAFGAKEVRRNSASSLRDNGNYLARILTKQSLDRPVAVTEFADCAPNPFRHEMGLFFSGYSALNGISLLLPHGKLLPETNFRPVAPHNYADFCDPIYRANDAVSAFAFLRGDVATSPHSVEFTVTPEILRSNHRLDALATEYSMLGFLTRIGVRADGVKPLDRVGEVRPTLTVIPEIFSRAYGTSVEAVTTDSKRSRPAVYADLIRRLRMRGVLPSSNRTDQSGTVFESDTGELLFEPGKGTLNIVTPRLAGVVLKENKPVSAGPLRVERCSVPAAVSLISLDSGRELPAAERLLLVFATDAANCGMTTTKDGSRLLALGGTPLLMRTGRLHLHLKNEKKNAPAVYALNLDGSRAEKIPVRQDREGLHLALDTAGLRYGTPFFEIVYQ